MILLSAEGQTNSAIAARFEVSAPTVEHWRKRFHLHGLAGLYGEQRPGRPRTHDHERMVGQRARAALIARIGEVAEDAVESTTVDGVPVVTAFSRSPHSGWAVVIGIPRVELSEPLVRSARVLLAGTAVVLLLIMALAWWMAT